MSKRLTESEKWNDVWFRNLPPHQKLIWVYCCDNCNLAGFLEVDLEKISFDTKLSTDEINGALKGLKRGLLESDGWIWIKNFLRHQRNLPLNPQNPLHKNILEKFAAQKNRFSLKEIEEYLGALKGLLSPHSNSNSKGNSSSNSKEGGAGGNHEDIETRKMKFVNDMTLFRNQYSDPMLRAFCEYWTEHSEGGLKMRFEMEKVFDKSRRLSTWKNNEHKFSRNGKQPITDEGIAEALRTLYPNG